MKKIISSVLAVSLLSIGISSVSAAPNNLGKEVLKPNDGWAAEGTGTSGGSKADNNHIFTVQSRSQLVQALGGDNSTNANNDTPKIIYVKGTIDLNVDQNNHPVGADYYAAGTGYDFNAYLAAYDPKTWGYTKKVAGDQGPEKARAAAEKNETNNVVINIGSNTTIVGLGDDAKIKGGNLMISGVSNVIIRNLNIEAPLDFFPQWDPTDDVSGNWNSAYDAISITNNANHIWIDHNTLGDGKHPDSTTGTYYNRPYQEHDGLCDITNGASYVTVSYNKMEDHDKTMLIGSSDSRTSDDGKLKVTLHDNYFKNVSERLARVRWGQVHIYNNYYEFNKSSEYPSIYALGVGVNSKIYAENNYFHYDYNVDPSTIIHYWKGTSIYESGSYVKTPSQKGPVDLVAAHNAGDTADPQLNENVGWIPTLFTKIMPTQSVPVIVKAKAGAGKSVD